MLGNWKEATGTSQTDGDVVCVECVCMCGAASGRSQTAVDLSAPQWRPKAVLARSHNITHARTYTSCSHIFSSFHLVSVFIKVFIFWQLIPPPFIPPSFCNFLDGLRTLLSLLSQASSLFYPSLLTSLSCLHLLLPHLFCSFVFAIGIPGKRQMPGKKWGEGEERHRGKEREEEKRGGGGLDVLLLSCSEGRSLLYQQSNRLPGSVILLFLSMFTAECQGPHSWCNAHTHTHTHTHTYTHRKLSFMLQCACKHTYTHTHTHKSTMTLHPKSTVTQNKQWQIYTADLWIF